GNENAEVKIFKYVTENTFDAYNWSIIENKQRFVGQIFTSKSPARSADDIDATALSYAEVKALATGDIRIKEKMDLDIQVAKLKLMRSNHQSQKYDMEDRLIKYYPVEIKKTEERIKGLKEDYKVVQAHPVADEKFSMTIKGSQYTERKSAGEAILLACKAIENPEDKVKLGEFRGFPMTLYVENGGFKVAMKNTCTHIAELENNITGNIVRINNVLENMPKTVENLQTRLENLITEQMMAKEEVETSFPKEQEYKEKVQRLTQLNKELDNLENEEVDTEQEKKPSVLKVLKDLKEDVKSEDITKETLQKNCVER
ncbi:MAG: helicase, partial [Anaerotignaceae bacterium]